MILQLDDEPVANVRYIVLKGGDLCGVEERRVKGVCKVRLQLMSLGYMNLPGHICVSKCGDEWESGYTLRL